jgi:hypothetical protein
VFSVFMEDITLSLSGTINSQQCSFSDNIGDIVVVRMSAKCKMQNVSSEVQNDYGDSSRNMKWHSPAHTNSTE